MAAMGGFAGLGHGLLILAHQRAPAPVLTPFNYTQLIWMIVSGMLVFGDRPPGATLLGAGLVGRVRVISGDVRTTGSDRRGSSSGVTARGAAHRSVSCGIFLMDLVG
jgi:hypothetical protein